MKLKNKKRTMMEKVVKRTKKIKYVFPNNFVSEKLVRKILTNISFFLKSNKIQKQKYDEESSPDKNNKSTAM